MLCIITVLIELTGCEVKSTQYDSEASAPAEMMEESGEKGEKTENKPTLVESTTDDKNELSSGIYVYDTYNTMQDNESDWPKARQNVVYNESEEKEYIQSFLHEHDANPESGSSLFAAIDTDISVYSCNGNPDCVILVCINGDDYPKQVCCYYVEWSNGEIAEGLEDVNLYETEYIKCNTNHVVSDQQDNVCLRYYYVTSGSRYIFYLYDSSNTLCGFIDYGGAVYPSLEGYDGYVGCLMRIVFYEHDEDDGFPNLFNYAHGLDETYHLVDFDEFYKGNIPAYDHADNEKKHYFSEITGDSNREYSVSDPYEYVDLDNDGDGDYVIDGPYGGIFLHMYDDRLYILAMGSGTSNYIDYTEVDGETWIYSYATTAGEWQDYTFRKLNAKAEEVDAIYMSCQGDEYWYNGETVSQKKWHEIRDRMLENSHSRQYMVGIYEY